MKRGLASPWVHSALAITRRLRLQLSRVDQRNSLKRRAGLPVRAASSSAWISSTAISSTSVAGEPEHVVDLVLLAPGHQGLAGEARVGPKQDAPPRPAGRDPGNDPLDLRDRPRRGIDVGAPELGGKEVAAAEHVERQIAGAVVVAVGEAAFHVN